ncbi:MAG: transposase [Planctomycetaceae bacterium]|nr:transposase [Planctomycetaceae bacterium]
MKKRKRHSPEQVVKKLRDADAMLAAGKCIGEVLQMLEVSEATLSRWRSQSGGMKSDEAKRLKMLEEENNRLKKIVGDKPSTSRCSRKSPRETDEPSVAT